MAERLADDERDGFFRIEGFADEATCTAMLAWVVDIARRAAAGDDVRPAFVLPESNRVGRPGQPEGLVSKIFGLHRDSVFEAFATDPRVTDVVADVLGAPTSTTSCRSSSSRRREPGASRGIRTRTTSRSNRPGPPSASGWPSPRRRSTTAASPSSAAPTPNRSTSTSPTVDPAPTTAMWRSAMVYHYAVAGTKDLTLERQRHSINDWIPARRGPRP